jgi:hypothetical protein
MLEGITYDVHESGLLDRFHCVSDGSLRKFQATPSFLFFGEGSLRTDVWDSPALLFPGFWRISFCPKVNSPAFVKACSALRSSLFLSTRALIHQMKEPSVSLDSADIQP